MGAGCVWGGRLGQVGRFSVVVVGEEGHWDGRAGELAGAAGMHASLASEFRRKPEPRLHSHYGRSCQLKLPSYCPPPPTTTTTPTPPLIRISLCTLQP